MARIVVHPLGGYGLEGKLWDLHVYLVYYDSGDDIPVGDYEFGAPLVPCQEYPFDVYIDGAPPMNLDTGYIKLVWTDENGQPIGWSSSQPGLE